MSCHSTPAFGGVPNSSNILAKPDKSFGVLGDTSTLVKRLSDWNSDLDSIEVERSFLSPVRLPSKLLMEQSSTLANYLDGHIASLLIQVQWESADSCTSGEPFACFFISSR